MLSSLHANGFGVAVYTDARNMKIHIGFTYENSHSQKSKFSECDKKYKDTIPRGPCLKAARNKGHSVSI